MTDRTRRIATVVLAPTAALLTWALIRLAGIDLVVSGADGQTIVGPADVLVAALVGALAAWAVVLLVERHSCRPRRVWSFVASTALAVSITGPSWLADGASAVALIALHVVTAVVVITGFAGTLPCRDLGIECAPRRLAAIRHDDSMTTLVRFRAGQILGLLFLIGPLADLRSGSQSSAQVAAISVAVAAFVALYLVLLPPVHAVARRGQPAIRAGLALMAALAGLTLALGAPRSFALLFVYVVAAAAVLLPTRWAVAVIGATTLAVATGLTAAGSDSSTIAAYTLTIVGLGAVMAALGSTMRANRELRAAQEELARLAVSEERLRIARDLHDLLGHTLSLIALKSELATKLVDSDPRRAQAEMAEVQVVTRQALTEVRQTVYDYRRLEFAEALDGARAALSAAGISCRVDSDAIELPAEVESVLAWAVREATTNVVRHSGARACAITVATDSEAVSLQVEDDGHTVSIESTDGTGLTGLADRARGLNGTLEAGARPAGGFRLRLTLPLRAT